MAVMMPNLESFRPPHEIRELNLLQELEKNPVISQRELSNRFGIALGVTNACIKRMVRRGWIRITGLNQRRIEYYLTPKGFTEKAKLSVDLISWTVRHYASLKDLIGSKLLEMQAEGVERVVFYGVCDEMEIAYITLQGVKMKLVGIVDDDEKYRPQFIFGYELEPVSRVRELRPEGILITTTLESDRKMDRVKKYLEATSVCIKDICLP
jgi:DNA-binding MarR family transcriptional regulator